VRFRYRLVFVIVVFCLLASVYVVSGEPRVLGFYGDGFGLFQMNSLSWGSVGVGGSVSRTVYVKNEADVVLGSVVFSGRNFVPAASGGFLSFSGSQVLDLEPNEIVPVTLTLEADDSVRGVVGFSFDVVATASYGGGGGGGVLSEPISVAVPVESAGLSSGQTLVLFVAVGVGVFVFVGGGKRR
jgi:hypothetical protein